MQANRRLAATLFTDIVGSTSMMQKDEQTAILVHKRYTAVLKQSVSSHNGEILKMILAMEVFVLFTVLQRHCAVQ